MPMKPKRGSIIEGNKRARAYYERMPVIFIITKEEVVTSRVVHGDLVDDLPTETQYSWTLHRHYKDEVQEAICTSAETWLTEKQCRAAINVAKKAMGGTRFAQTKLKDETAGGLE